MGTSSDKAAILALLKKYRAGACTPEETTRIEQWFEDAEELRDTEEMTQAANEAVNKTMQQLFPRRGNIVYILLSAAAILLVAVTGLLFVYKNATKTPAPVTYASVTTKRGQRRKLTLPDGSRLILNAGTSLSIPSDFGEKTRELILTGEATFDISQHAEKPFIIHTGNMRTVVLGTSFNIKAYPGDKAMQVAVLSGKVRIEKKEQQKLRVLAESMIKDQLLTYEENTGKHELKKCNAADIAGWQENRLFFDQATIEEITDVLERQYNVNITLIGTTKRLCRYTLQLKNESLNNALLLLEQLSGISYQVNNKEIKINIASCE